MNLAHVLSGHFVWYEGFMDTNFAFSVFLPYRFFKQLLVVFLLQQMAAGLFRLIAGVSRTMIIANTVGSLALLVVFMLGGFILRKG